MKLQEHTVGFTSRGPDCTDGDVKLCPLHKSAPLMLSALQKLRDAFQRGILSDNRPNHPAMKALYDALLEAEEAL